MIFLLVLAVSAILWLGIIELQNLFGKGTAWRIVDLSLLLILGSMFIFAAVTAPSEPRAVLLQVGAALLTTIPIYLVFLLYKNRKGW
ncbi:MAG: hypothetical protein LBS19_05885 [Clostridiales bacterium]|jgi:hypothetical protein|nr:hypothetical protein [Clostridiales bacterium]